MGGRSVSHPEFPCLSVALTRNLTFIYILRTSAVITGTVIFPILQIYIRLLFPAMNANLHLNYSGRLPAVPFTISVAGRRAEKG